MLAGSVNGAGVPEVTAIAGAVVSPLARLLASASHTRQGSTDVERFARVYTPIVLGLAVVVGLVPFLL